MQNSQLILPDYYRVIECCGDLWHFKKMTPFYTRIPISIDYNDFELLYGISKQQVINEAARIRQGEPGFYLVNLRQKRYYYCGKQSKDVRAMLLSLGIGRSDPRE